LLWEFPTAAEPSSYVTDQVGKFVIVQLLFSNRVVLSSVDLDGNGNMNYLDTNDTVILFADTVKTRAVWLQVGPSNWSLNTFAPSGLNKTLLISGNGTTPLVRLDNSKSVAFLAFDDFVWKVSLDDGRVSVLYNGTVDDLFVEPYTSSVILQTRNATHSLFWSVPYQTADNTTFLYASLYSDVRAIADGEGGFIVFLSDIVNWEMVSLQTAYSAPPNPLDAGPSAVTLLWWLPNLSLDKIIYVVGNASSFEIRSISLHGGTVMVHLRGEGKFIDADFDGTFRVLYFTVQQTSYALKALKISFQVTSELVLDSSSNNIDFAVFASQTSPRIVWTSDSGIKVSTLSEDVGSSSTSVETQSTSTQANNSATALDYSFFLAVVLLNCFLSL